MVRANVEESITTLPEYVPVHPYGLGTHAVKPPQSAELTRVKSCVPDEYYDNVLCDGDAVYGIDG